MKRFKNILLVVDPELKDDAVLERAVALAENNQARLTVISVIEGVPTDSGIDRYGVEPDKLQSAMIEARLQQLESLIEPAREQVGVSTKVLTGTPFLDIVRKHLQWLNGLRDDLATWVGKDALDYVKPQMHLLKGNAKDEIPRLAGELQVDLIVMGTLARAGIPGFIMGNTAETILNRIDCSVLAVKPDGFVTPVMLEH